MSAIEIADRQGTRLGSGDPWLQTDEVDGCGVRDLEFEAVASQVYMRRQQTLGLDVAQVVRDVREISAAGSQLFDVFERAFDGGVRRMRLVAQCIEEEDVKSP